MREQFFVINALLEKRTLPRKNLLAVLSDSASKICGMVTGLETKLRGYLALHLLDIDGESCHHMYNIVKKFTLFFNNFWRTC